MLLTSDGEVDSQRRSLPLGDVILRSCRYYQRQDAKAAKEPGLSPLSSPVGVSQLANPKLYASCMYAKGDGVMQCISS